jgi:hypothetical protein
MSEVKTSKELASDLVTLQNELMHIDKYKEKEINDKELEIIDCEIHIAEALISEQLKERAAKTEIPPQWFGDSIVRTAMETIDQKLAEMRVKLAPPSTPVGGKSAKKRRNKRGGKSAKKRRSNKKR